MLWSLSRVYNHELDNWKDGVCVCVCVFMKD